jgi:hypothetical protein
MANKNSSIKALRALLRDPAIPLKDIAKHVRELTGRNDRLVAVVCGSVIEFNLRGLLESAMPNGPRQLFEPHAPLSTFSAKIELAYSLNLIDGNIRRNADYIREVRNVFAHRVAPTDFRTKEVVAVCKLLMLGKRQEYHKDANSNMRTRFLLAATSTGSAIAGRRLSPNGSSPASLSGKSRPQHPEGREDGHRN